MGEIHLPGPVKLITAILAQNGEWLSKARERLVKAFGRIDVESPDLPFGFTTYYADEMGEGLHKQWVGFVSLVLPDGLAGIKHMTNLMEQKMAWNGKRRANLDPGYLNDSRLVLATTKDFAHRIYLGSGIFAETTMIYKEEAFCALDWTYPDYQCKEVIKFLEQARAHYLAQREKFLVNERNRG